MLSSRFVAVAGKMHKGGNWVFSEGVLSNHITVCWQRRSEQQSVAGLLGD